MKIRALVVQLMLGALTLSSAVSAQTTRTTEPGAYETEVWRTATKLDVIEGYNAYLSKFPQGAFAELARLSIRKLSGDTGASAAVAAKPSPAPSSTPAKTLLPVSETSALPLKVGNRLIGPGVITVGSWGAKRQLLIPGGEWMLIAAFDHTIKGLSPLLVTTAAFASFAGNEVNSILVTTFNTRAVPSIAPAQMHNTTLIPHWPASDACEQAAADELFAVREPARFALHTCAFVRKLAGQDDPLAIAPGLRARVDSALTQLGLPQPSLALRTDVHLTEPTQAYLGYVRLDAAPKPGSRGAAATPAEWSATRVAWAKNFTPLASLAYRRKIDLDDLEADKQPAAQKGVDLPF